MSAILVKNGRIITDAADYTADILIRDGKIAQIGEELKEPSADVIDAAGLYVFPGGVDAHVHMALDLGGGLVSSDDFSSGSIAALCGGTTTLIDFVTPQRGQSLIEAAIERKAAAKASFCDYGLHMSITYWNKNVPREMGQCGYEEGMTSFKVYLAYKETIGLEDRDLLAVMDAAARLDLLVTAHCEHGDAVAYLQKQLIRQGKTGPENHPLSRPPQVEVEAVQRALLLAEATDCPLYVVHVSTAGAVQQIARARDAGQRVWAETCPHYLLLDESYYNQPGFSAAAYVMSPPLRPKAHAAALWEACAHGTIQVAATDHCPFNMKEKELGRHDFSKIPNGAAGVENRLSLLYTYGVLEKRISLQQFVALTAANPAKIFGLYPGKGTIQKGADADLVIWDPNWQGFISAKTLHHHCDTSIYEGFPITGQPRLVIANGQLVVKEGHFLPTTPNGRYLPRNNETSREL